MLQLPLFLPNKFHLCCYPRSVGTFIISTFPTWNSSSQYSYCQFISFTSLSNFWDFIFSWWWRFLLWSSGLWHHEVWVKATTFYRNSVPPSSGYNPVQWMHWYIFPPKCPYPPTRQGVTTQMTRIWVLSVTFSTAVTNYNYSPFQKYGYVIYRITLRLRKCNLNYTDAFAGFMTVSIKSEPSANRAVKYCVKRRHIYCSLKRGKRPSRNPMWPPRAVTTIATCFDWCAAWIGIAGKKSIWHSQDRASWYILIIKANKMHYFSNLFW